MDWTFYAAIVVIVVLVASLFLWRPEDRWEKDDVEDAIQRYLKHRRKP